MTMKVKIKLAVLLLLMNYSVYSQMTTVYECGATTPNYFLSEFIYGTMISSTGNPPQGQTTFNNNGNGVDALFKYPGHDNGMFTLIRSIPVLSLYTSVEFYIEYTLMDTTSNLSLYLSDYLGTSTIPSANGNIVSSNVPSSLTIPFNNLLGDSVIKLIFNMSNVDSVFINLNYLRVDVDLSSAVSIDESTLQIAPVTIFSNENKINIVNEEAKEYNVQVFNLIGQEIFNKKINNSTEIPLTNYSGVFIVVVSDNISTFSQKVFLKN
jgi:hypothetical protein